MSDAITNRHAGTVALPEAGEGVYLQFDVNAFEQLETAFSAQEDHIAHIMKGMVQMKVSVFAKVLSATLKGETSKVMPYGLKWEELTDRVMDALCLAIHGRTAAEQKEVEIEEINKRMMDRLQGIEAHPQAAAILSLMSAGQPVPEQDSNPEKSAA
ncbi:hypothetical protein [Shinella zoogloeoides]|uniref:hypothetical protein n=1 Tax=Shinella zoogloeoides TaxID=352475 RepID=UPI00299D3829|nr:hypothetical protein [Shinella zoogloeoides]WPE19963.1 hypothetical protein ShzoTeo12_11430 [Shinella zoogloeoides]